MADTWRVCGAWDEIATVGRFGAEGADPLRVEAFDAAHVVAIEAPAVAATALAQWLETNFATSLPAVGRAARGAGCAVLWAGAGKWLLRQDNGVAAHARWPDPPAGATLVDQSDGRAVLRIGGARVRAALAKGVMLDLDPGVFGPDATAVTAIAHIRAQIWRVDAGEGPPAFEIIVPRTFAESFWSWLGAAGAEFGLDIRRRP